MTPADLMKRLSDCVQDGIPVALVTVTDSSGSIPREPGAKMLVFEDGRIAGTVGGGKLELQAVRDARKALTEGRGRKVVYELEPDLGMICGGKAEVFIDVFVESLKIVICGAGHVGEKTAQLSALLGVPHSVVDDRASFASAERFPAARKLAVGPQDEALKSLRVDKDTAVVIATQGHRHDEKCLAAALGTPAFYIGVIGSRAKVAEVFENFRKKGLKPSSDPRVHSPIGLELGGRTPEAIALSIMAEVFKERHGTTGRHLRIGDFEDKGAAKGRKAARKGAS